MCENCKNRDCCMLACICIPFNYKYFESDT